MTCLADTDLGDAGDERQFRAIGSYVWEVSEGRPGTLGDQVGLALYHSGAMLSSAGDLASIIRREARRCLREQAAAEVAS